MAAENNRYIRTYGQPKLTYNFILHGESNVGKTALFNAYANANPHARLTVDGLRQYLVESGAVAGQPCDVMLQDIFQSDRCSVYQEAPPLGIILVCALDDFGSLRDLPGRRDEMLAHLGINVKRSLFPCVLLANKRDIPKKEQRIRDDHLQLWCRQESMTFFKTSNRETDAHIMQDAIKSLIRTSISNEAGNYTRLHPVSHKRIRLDFEITDNRDAGCFSCCSLL